MSDQLQFLVDEHATAGEAASLATRLRERLVADGWLESRASARCVLDGRGHRPGPRVGSHYARQKGEGDFLSLQTNGVVIASEPFTNLVQPYAIDLLTCPACNESVDPDALLEAVSRWLAGEDVALVRCGACGARSHLRSLGRTDDREPPVVCGHVSVVFYNWPPLDLSGWRESIVDVIRDVLGHRPSLAWATL